jgi:hypothetical protein
MGQNIRTPKLKGAGSLTQYRSNLLYYRSMGALLLNRRRQISNVYTITSAVKEAVTVELCRRKTGIYTDCESK